MLAKSADELLVMDAGHYLHWTWRTAAVLLRWEVSVWNVDGLKFAVKAHACCSSRVLKFSNEAMTAIAEHAFPFIICPGDAAG